ncbi:hypothetical protein [Clostridium saccharoperbutylacetonicum]|uniref:hypothetical protein n=1 Tax=Clostridium saccharoperbutylacetonicum TaxID=36745 RepID=UPI0039ED1AA5
MDSTQFIKVPNQYIKGEDQFNDYELLTYVLIKKNYLLKDTFVFNLLELTRLLGKLDKKKYKDDMGHFKESLKKLQEDNVFQFFSDKYSKEQIDVSLSDNNYLIYALEMEDIEGEFTKIYEDDLEHIIKNIGDTKISIYGLCHYFIYLNSFIYESATSQQFGYCTQNKTSEDIGLCKESKSKYEMYLEQIKIMKFEVLGSVKTNGEYKTSKTYFCRYTEKGISDLAYEVERLLKEKELIVLDEDKKKKINEKRKNTSIINYLETIDDKTEIQVKRLNKLLKRNEDLTNIKNTEIEKVKPKEEKPKHRGIWKASGSDNELDDWGNPYTLDSMRKEIIEIGNELEVYIDKEEVKKLIKGKNHMTENLSELKIIKNLLKKELDSYEDLPY